MPSDTAINPQALLAIRDLEMRARVVVEGLWSGLHRSPLQGFSVEFTEYREYSQGDDLRYLDWRALARTDKEYIKKFEDETNLRCHIVLDTSRSMLFGSLDYNKADYARSLAATLAYFLIQQRDVVGLSIFDSKVRDYLPARWRPGQLRLLLSKLQREPRGNETNLGQALEEVALLNQKRSLILIISDFLTPPSEWEKEISHLVAMRHDVRAIQILDPAELSLDFGTAAQWEDLETGKRVYIDPDVARKDYLEKLSEHQEKVKKSFDERGVSFQMASTDTPLDYVLLDMIKSGGLARKTIRANHRRSG
ncbi:MAG: DUF58 domain-containing protein [Verrucomicrobia bacterium]|nr:DUF58 domain-containing protein [Verrucomicrobiota bacterium]MDA1066221.1 DUF58 domain-containing protein [Verrucomicrobiota bacterium]